MTWQRSMPAWGPVGLLSSDLLFMTWQRESTNLCLLVFSSVLGQRKGASWAPLGLFSSALLFMT